MSQNGSDLIVEEIALLKFSEVPEEPLSRLKESDGQGNSKGLIPAIMRDAQSDTGFKNVKFYANQLSESEYDAVVSSEEELNEAMNDDSVSTIFVRGTSIMLEATQVNTNKSIFSDGRSAIGIKKLRGEFSSVKFYCHTKFLNRDISDIITRGLYLTTVEAGNSISNVSSEYVYEKYTGSGTPTGKREYWTGSGDVYVYPKVATKTEAGIVVVGDGLDVDNGVIRLDGNAFTSIKDEEDGNAIVDLVPNEHELEIKRRMFIRADERKADDSQDEFTANSTVSFNNAYRVATIARTSGSDKAALVIDTNNHSGSFKVFLKLAFRDTLCDVCLTVVNTVGRVDISKVSAVYSCSITESTSIGIRYAVKEGVIYIYSSYTLPYDIVDAYISGFLTDEYDFDFRVNETIPTGIQTAPAKFVSHIGLTGSMISTPSIVTIKDGVVAPIENDENENNKLFVLNNGNFVPLENAGGIDQPIFVEDGSLQPIRKTTSNNKILMMKNGVFKDSDANIGGPGKFVYINNGTFVEANANVEVNQLINLSDGNSIIKINGEETASNSTDILPNSVGDWANTNPNTASVYITGTTSSNLMLNNANAFKEGSSIEIFTLNSVNITIGVSSGNANWVYNGVREDGISSKTIAVTSHASIIRSTNESNIPVFFIISDGV